MKKNKKKMKKMKKRKKMKKTKKKVQIFICRKPQFKQEANIHVTKIELRDFITEIL